MRKSQARQTGQLHPQVPTYSGPRLQLPHPTCFCFLADSGFIIPGNKKDIHQVFLRKCASHSLHEEMLRLQRGKRGGSTSQYSSKAGSKRHQLPHGLIQNMGRYLETNRAFWLDPMPEGTLPEPPSGLFFHLLPAPSTRLMTLI